MEIPAPDLRIRIQQSDQSLTFQVWSRDPSIGPALRTFGPVALGMSPRDWIDGLRTSAGGMEDLSEASNSADRRAEAQERLDVLGISLFRKLPEGLQALLWSLRGKAETVQILSDESLIPWELMKLQHRGPEGWETGGFFCEELAVTRWLDKATECLHLPARAIACVVPGGSEISRREREDLAALRGPEREIFEVEPRREPVVRELRSGDHDAWHFGGHHDVKSADADGSWLELEKGDKLWPDDLGVAESFARCHPLVFLNGCDTARGGPTLIGAGGWARHALDAGAGAFIGTFWPVKASRARAFAKAFYRHFLDGEPMAEAVRKARLEVRSEFPGDPAWLAYTVFAHPMAVFSPEVGMPLRKAASPLVIRQRTWQRGISPPGALLRAEYGIVPFHGRESEMGDLRAWCLDELPLRVRLYTGPGGMGKTRLALEIAQELKEKGWRAGFLEPERLASPEQAWAAVARPGGRVLAIVDYAETRRGIIVPLVRGMMEAEDGPYRLILLARAALDWWEQLKSERYVGEVLAGPATSRHPLKALALTLDDRKSSYLLAGRSFAESLEKTAPAEAPEDLDAPFFERVLLLHMNALASVEGVRVKGEDGILDYVLARERRYWGMRAEDLSLPPTVFPAISRAMAAITLGGGVDGEEQAVEVLRSLKSFEGCTGDVLLAVARLLHEGYSGERWIEPVLPDLLGEHLAQRELEQGADELLDLVLGPRR